MHKTLGERLLLPLNVFYKGKNRLAGQAYGAHPDMRYDEYPADDAAAPIVVFWYGGSWKTGNKQMYRFVGGWLQAMGAHAFVVDYPKYPDRVFPGFVEDAKAALEHIRARFPGRSVTLMGHSAGANTALLVAMTASDPVDRVVAMAGACTLAPEHWQAVFGAANLKAGRHDPRSYASTSPARTSYLLIHGRLDRIVSVDDSISLHALLQQAGHSSQLVLIRLMGHILILPLIVLGSLPRTSRIIRGFIIRP